MAQFAQRLLKIGGQDFVPSSMYPMIKILKMSSLELLHSTSLSDFVRQKSPHFGEILKAENLLLVKYLLMFIA